jgi:hypothetical protein
VLQTYTIIGISVTGSRHNEVIEAHSAAEAELGVSEGFEYIACVLEGAVTVDPADVYDEERDWSVFSFYTDNEQRHGTTVQARSAQEAEVRAHEALNEDLDPEMDEALEICVCGVTLGEQMVVDLYAGDEGWANADLAVELLREEAEEEALKLATRPLPEIGARSRQSGLSERLCIA